MTLEWDWITAVIAAATLLLLAYIQAQNYRQRPIVLWRVSVGSAFVISDESRDVAKTVTVWNIGDATAIDVQLTFDGDIGISGFSNPSRDTLIRIEPGMKFDFVMPTGLPLLEASFVARHREYPTRRSKLCVARLPIGENVDFDVEPRRAKRSERKEWAKHINH